MRVILNDSCFAGRPQTRVSLSEHFGKATKNTPLGTCMLGPTKRVPIFGKAPVRKDPSWGHVHFGKATKKSPHVGKAPVQITSILGTCMLGPTKKSPHFGKAPVRKDPSWGHVHFGKATKKSPHVGKAPVQITCTFWEGHKKEFWDLGTCPQKRPMFGFHATQHRHRQPAVVAVFVRAPSFDRPAIPLLQG